MIVFLFGSPELGEVDGGFGEWLWGEEFFVTPALAHELLLLVCLPTGLSETAYLLLRFLQFLLDARRDLLLLLFALEEEEVAGV